MKKYYYFWNILLIAETEAAESNAAHAFDMEVPHLGNPARRPPARWRVGNSYSAQEGTIARAI